MKLLNILSALLLILVTAACSTIPKGVMIDYDQDADFENYQTFYWSDEILQNKIEQPLFYNSLVKKRIKEAVESELTGRGYVLNENNPDLVINAHMLVEEKTEYQSAPFYGYSYYGRDNVRVTNYKEGTLVIDLIDRNQKQLIWQGSFQGGFTDAKTPEEKSRAIRDAVSLIFAEYEHRADK